MESCGRETETLPTETDRGMKGNLQGNNREVFGKQEYLLRKISFRQLPNHTIKDLFSTNRDGVYFY